MCATTLTNAMLYDTNCLYLCSIGIQNIFGLIKGDDDFKILQYEYTANDGEYCLLSRYELDERNSGNNPHKTNHFIEHLYEESPNALIANNGKFPLSWNIDFVNGELSFYIGDDDRFREVCNHIFKHFQLPCLSYWNLLNRFKGQIIDVDSYRGLSEIYMASEFETIVERVRDSIDYNYNYFTEAPPF